MSYEIKFTAENTETGEVIPVSRDVCQAHPAWVHDQCGTRSEAELQAYISQCDVSDYYRADGSHKGADDCGISVRL